MKNFNLSYLPYGKNAILAKWPDCISEEILNDIISFRQALKQQLKEPVRETVPAYNSVLIIFSEAVRDFSKMEEVLEKVYHSRSPSQNKSRDLVHIPVCYDKRFAPDIDELAGIKGISAGKVVELHTAPVYTVYFIGFLPGFMYLGGLDPVLHQPRKKTPRLRIEKGAVGIAGSQTGIYPLESPGGWNIIGNSPIRFLDPLSDPPFFAGAGDKIKFFPVTAGEHEMISDSHARGEYVLKKEVWND